MDGNGDLTLGDITATGDFEATSTDGDITQADNTTIEIAGDATLEASEMVNGQKQSRNITLDGASNDFGGTVNADGANITLVDGNGGLTLGDFTTTGKLDATAVTDINISGNVIAEDVTFDAGRDININGNVTADTLNADAGGSITQSEGSTLAIENTVTLNAGDAITLDGTLNAADTTLTAINDVILNGTLNVAALDVTSTEGNITVNGELTANDLTLDAANNIAINGDVTADTLNADAGGDITQGTNGTLVVNDGPTNLQAGNDITLSGANDFNGLVNADGNNIALNDVNGLTLGTVNARADVQLASVGDLDLGSLNAAGTLQVNSGGGNITQSGSLTVGGLASLDAGSGRIALLNPGNKLPKGANIFAASFAVTGDSRKGANEVSAKVLSSTATSKPVSALDDTAVPEPLVMSSNSTTSSPITSSPVTTDPSASSAASNMGAGNNNAGVVVDLRNAPTSNVSFMAAVSIPFGTATSGTGFSFTLPENVRALVTESTQPTATMPDGTNLPSWLKFDVQSLRFEATAVPSGAFPMQLVLTLGAVRVAVVISERTE